MLAELLFTSTFSQKIYHSFAVQSYITACWAKPYAQQANEAAFVMRRADDGPHDGIHRGDR